MIVIADLLTASVMLADKGDFSRLKIAVHGERDESRMLDLLGARAAPDAHVWLPAAAIEIWAGSQGDGWTTAFRAMLAKVEPYGWYDAATDEVKAHVEWNVVAGDTAAR